MSCGQERLKLEFRAGEIPENQKTVKQEVTRILIDCKNCFQLRCQILFALRNNLNVTIRQF